MVEREDEYLPVIT